MGNIYRNTLRGLRLQFRVGSCVTAGSAIPEENCVSLEKPL